MIMNEFKRIRGRNLIGFSSAKERLNSGDETFINKVKTTSASIEENKDQILDVLEDFFDHPNINLILENFYNVTFNRHDVETTLKDETYVAFLIVSNLYNRIMKPGFKENGSLIVRVYFSILDFMNYINN